MQQISWWQAIVLGLAQGLTEFIPVSSSAHLNILHWMFGQGRNLDYDVVLHIGTVCALAWYFRRDWAALLRDPMQAQLRNFVFIACIPAGIAGYFLRHLEDNPPFSLVKFNAILLIVAGIVLWLADRYGRKTRIVESVTLSDALIIGSSQVLALFPGVSRSGSTISAGLMLGLTRESAARFSFLLSLPITLGAVLFSLKDVHKNGLASLGAGPPVLLLGVLVSAISGFWAIGFLLNFLKRHTVTPFVLWRIGVALLVFSLLVGGAREVPQKAAPHARSAVKKTAR